MRVLVTGGLGYIGSHTIVELAKEFSEIIIVDNLTNSKIQVMDNIKKITNRNFIFFRYYVTNYNQMKSIFEKYEVNSIIHFAGLKSVYESIQ